MSCIASAASTADNEYIESGDFSGDSPVAHARQVTVVVAVARIAVRRGEGLVLVLDATDGDCLHAGCRAHRIGDNDDTRAAGATRAFVVTAAAAATGVGSGCCSYAIVCIRSISCAIEVVLRTSTPTAFGCCRRVVIRTTSATTGVVGRGSIDSA